MAGVKGRSGGARPNSGPKRRDPKAAWLTGAAKRRPVAVAPLRTPADAPRCPTDADDETRQVWDELGPHALAQGTLDERTAFAFLLLCRNVVFERKLAASPLTCAGSDHRGMLMRVEAGLTRFRLTANGQPVVVAEEPKDEWSEFLEPWPALPGGKA